MNKLIENFINYQIQIYFIGLTPGHTEFLTTRRVREGYVEYKGEKYFNEIIFHITVISSNGYKNVKHFYQVKDEKLFSPCKDVWLNFHYWIFQFQLCSDGNTLAFAQQDHFCPT